MRSITIATLGLAAIAAVADWCAVVVGSRRVEYVAKPLATLLLIVTAIVLDPADTTQRDWFVAALVASLIGDVALMLPSAGEGDADGASSAAPTTFIVGLSAFLIAHVAYLGGFLLGELHPVGLVVGAAVVVVASVSVGTAIIRGSWRGGDVAVTAALVVYLLVIGAMVVAAYGSGRPFAIVGASLFFASDALIGWTRFVRPMAHGRLAVMATYHLGQVGLVVSLLG